MSWGELGIKECSESRFLHWITSKGLADSAAPAKSSLKFKIEHRTWNVRLFPTEIFVRIISPEWVINNFPIPVYLFLWLLKRRFPIILLIGPIKKEDGWRFTTKGRWKTCPVTVGFLKLLYLRLLIIELCPTPINHLENQWGKNGNFTKKKKIQNTSIHIFYRQLLLISTQINVVNISEEILRLVVCRQFSKLLGF